MRTEKYQSLYRIPSARATWWDYSENGAYFITICTAKKMPYFGEIKNQKMHYSPCGALAYTLWNEIPHHTQNVELGEMIVMPDHIHGILILSGNDSKIYTPTRPKDPKSIEQIVQKMSVISPKSNSVSVIVRSYKSAVTKYANRMGLPTGWQSRFHDHIIRDDEEYCRIEEYIRTNPARWNPKS